MKRLFGLFFGIAALAAVTTAANAQSTTAKAIVAGGCFWCVEHDFMKLDGVIDAVSGYSGGSRPDPAYENYNKVDGENTVPHEEVVEITYDPAKLSYRKLIDYFFRHIDPTDGGGQFCDRGPGYRPFIYAANAEERSIAEAASIETGKLIKQPVAVGILDAGKFWPAEDYHQNYAETHPTRYKFYRWNCGRDQRVEAVWSVAPPMN